MYFLDVADSQNFLELEEDDLRDVVVRTLECEQVASADLSLAIVDNPTIRDLNVRYLQHDYDTDVLSFLFDVSGGDEDSPQESGPEGESFRPRGAGKRIEGEIIVSAEMALESARQYGWNPRDELILYIVHGLLHLTGYDDLSPEEKAVMRRRERDVLSLWNLSPRYAENALDADSSTAESGT